MSQALLALLLLFADRQPQGAANNLDAWERTRALSKQFEAQGKFTEARNTLLGAMGDAAKSPERLAYAYNNLGAIAYQLGKYAEAERDYRLALRQWDLVPDNPGMAKTLGNIAALNFAIGRMDVADDFLRRAEGLQIKSMGADHPETALLLQNHASMDLVNHQYKKAEPLFRRALEIWERSGGAYDADIAIAARSLAVVYKHTSRTREAAAYDQRARKIWEHELTNGTAAPDVRPALARLYLEMHEPLRAEPLLKEAIRLSETELGPDYPFIGAIFEMYSEVCRQTSRKAEAREMEHRARQIENSCTQLCVARQTVNASDLIGKQNR